MNPNAGYPNPAPKAPATPNVQPNQASIPSGTKNPAPVGTTLPR